MTRIMDHANEHFLLFINCSQNNSVSRRGTQSGYMCRSLELLRPEICDNDDKLIFHASEKDCCLILSAETSTKNRLISFM